MRRLLAEWEHQRMVQLTWPHSATDWNYILDDAEDNFLRIACAIMRYEKLLIISEDAERIHRLLGDDVEVLEIASNDTWARDHGGITIEEDGNKKVLDFCFNGWGMKFAADKDNLITERMAGRGCFERLNCRDFVLEGGSIETDGCGTLLTTSLCLLSPNRNATLTRQEVEQRLCREFGVSRVLWLEHGAMAGDDTDSHIDTLARLAPGDTIIYQGCQTPDDSHYEEMQAMKRELLAFRTKDGLPYRLVELPMPMPQYEDDFRLPATYANYLVVNGAVLVPTYDCPQDGEALTCIKSVFPDRDAVGIDCRTLIRQHGSLHCVTMQYY